METMKRALFVVTSVLHLSLASAVIVKTPLDRIMNLRVLIINIKKKYSIVTILNRMK